MKIICWICWHSISCEAQVITSGTWLPRLCKHSEKLSVVQKFVLFRFSFAMKINCASHVVFFYWSFTSLLPNHSKKVQVWWYLRVGNLPRGVAVSQPVALLDEDQEALAAVVIARREDNYSAHLHSVKVSSFTVNTHHAAQCALQTNTDDMNKHLLTITMFALLIPHIDCFGQKCSKSCRLKV